MLGVAASYERHRITERTAAGRGLAESAPSGWNAAVVAANRLAMSRVALSRVLNGKAGISPDLALRLEQTEVSSA